MQVIKYLYESRQWYQHLLLTQEFLWVFFKDGSIISGAKGDASGNRNPATTETYQAIQASAETISAEYLDTAGEQVK